MQPTPRTATQSRPNRLLVALAAAWMILSLAIGGAVQADSSPSLDTGSTVSTSAQD